MVGIKRAGVLGAAMCLLGASVAVNVASAQTPPSATYQYVSDLSATPYDDAGEWATDVSGNGTPVINDRYGSPSGFLGQSLFLSTDPDGKAQTLRNLPEPVTAAELTAMDEISYWVYRDSASTARRFQTPSVQLVVDLNGGELGDGPDDFTILVYEPVYNGFRADQNGPVAEDTWVQFDDLRTANWWSSQDLPNADYDKTLDDYIAENPNLEVLRVGFNQGTGNDGLLAAAEGLVFDGVTYDFQLPEFEVTKEVAENTDNGDGTFNIAYDVTVENVAAFRTPYDLTDQLAVGDGVAIDNVAVSSGDADTSSSFDGQGDTTITQDQSLDPGDTDSFRIDVSVTVDPDAASESSVDCATDGTSGVENAATVTDVIDQTSQDGACASVAIVEPTPPTTAPPTTVPSSTSPPTLVTLPPTE